MLYSIPYSRYTEIEGRLSLTRIPILSFLYFLPSIYSTGTDNTLGRIGTSRLVES